MWVAGAPSASAGRALKQEQFPVCLQRLFQGVLYSLTF